MHNDISIEERIDSYLLDRMSDEERRAFEADLEKDAELKEEYECQKEIANAVQRVAMREFLEQLASKQKAEKAISPEGEEIRIAACVKSEGVEEGPFVGSRPAATASMTEPFEVIRNFFWSKQGVWVLASIAAAVVIVVTGGLSYSSASKAMSIRGDYMFAEVREYVPRGGGDKIDSLLVSAYNLIKENEFESALTTIEEAKKLIDDEKPAEVVTEKDKYTNRLLQMKDDELDWYKAIALMKQGKVFKARKNLKVISSSDSRYAEPATEELKKPFSRKKAGQ